MQQSGTFTVTAFGDVEIDVYVSFDNEEFEIEGMEIAGMAFYSDGIKVNGKELDDIINDQIAEELDAIGWANGQEACERADAKRKEAYEDR